MHRLSHLPRDSDPYLDPSATSGLMNINHKEPKLNTTPRPLCHCHDESLRLSSTRHERERTRKSSGAKASYASLSRHLLVLASSGDVYADWHKNVIIGLRSQTLGEPGERRVLGERQTRQQLRGRDQDDSTLFFARRIISAYGYRSPLHG